MSDTIKIDPMLKAIWEIQEIILAAGGIKKPAHGLFFRGLYVAPGISVGDVIKQYKLREDLRKITEVLQELKEKVSKALRDPRIHYTNIGLDAVFGVQGSISSALEQIESHKKENMALLVDMFQKTTGGEKDNG